MRHLLFLALIPAAAAAQVSFGTAALIDDGWAFSLGDNANAKQAAFDDHAWRRVELPHDWSIEETPTEKLGSCTGYLPGGIGWYRKTVNISTRKGGEKVFLYFEGVYNRSEVYFNGHLLGKRPNGFVSFVYDATPFVKFDGENTIAVRVDHHLSADSRWYTGSGINRNVFLIRSGFQHIAPFGVFVQPEVGKGEGARLRIATELQNETDQPT
ncbi:MAG TPA: sugar-binding domain-containing protein, partial [Opitutaceae bacterium]